VPVYCASGFASIALRAERFGYGLHGHDAEVVACVNLPRVINLDDVRDALDAVLEQVDHKPLWEVIPGDPVLEDLACHVASRIANILRVDITRVSVEVRIPRGKIIVFGGEEYCREGSGSTGSRESEA